MGIRDRIRASAGPARPGRTVAVSNMGVDQYISEYVIPASTSFTYGGVTYSAGGAGSQQLQTTYGNRTVQQFASTLPGYSEALNASPPAFAAQLVRALVISQARLIFRNRPGWPNPRKVFGTRALDVLDTPWPGGTVGDLLGRMEWHAGLAGNAFVTNWTPGRLRMLRPDWMIKVYGSELEPDDASTAIDATLLGYAYCNGGFHSGNRIVPLTPDEVSHWYPLPDPVTPEIGMSWVTPAIREIRGDLAATEHKLMFFQNGATPNLVVKGIPAASKTQFDELVDMMEERHAGVKNAYRTLYLTLGADADVVGADLKQIDFAAVQGKSETRLSVLSRVPASLLGISEGLAGSALNAGNFGAARRSFADTWVFPTLQNLAGSLSPLVGVPRGAELWFDTADIGLLREDAKDAAEIVQLQASTITSLVNAGFEPDAVLAAVQGLDISQLLGKHTGMLSVQLQPPGTTTDGAAPASGQTNNGPAAPAGRTSR